MVVEQWALRELCEWRYSAIEINTLTALDLDRGLRLFAVMPLVKILVSQN